MKVQVIRLLLNFSGVLWLSKRTSSEMNKQHYESSCVLCTIEALITGTQLFYHIHLNAFIP